MNSYVQYILVVASAHNGPQRQRMPPRTIPSRQPMIDQARSLLEAGGVKTVSYEVYPAETTDFTPIAQKVIASNAQVVVLGSMLPDIIAYVQAFKQQHFNPKSIVASAGPDQGSQFTGPIGGANVAEGICFPNAGPCDQHVPECANGAGLPGYIRWYCPGYQR